MSRVADDPEAYVEAIIKSGSNKRLVIAGPGTGKTYLFRRILEANPGDRNRRLILTFINNLADELERELGHLSRVYTFHAYCHLLLRRQMGLRGDLLERFRYFPKLVRLIKSDWEATRGSEAPLFVTLMRNVERGAALDFYLERGHYYQAISYDDSVFRVHEALAADAETIPEYDLVLVDEYQDFNRVEVELIEFLARRNRVLIVGDDDQALYSQLRGSDPRFIRELYRQGDYEAFPLPYCMRCTDAIVGAVNDVVQGALSAGGLRERIEKPYLYYAPVKQADSNTYPRIKVVETTVQRLGGGNYFARYIAQEIERIPAEEIRESLAGNFPTVLVIASNPYRWQVVQDLRLHGYTVEMTEDVEPPVLERADAFRILKEEPESNLGWRILLEIDRPTGADEFIVRCVQERIELVEALPQAFREAALREAAAWREETAVVPETAPEDVGRPSVRATSFEGAKGLSTQHVFVVGVHDRELPRNPRNMQDLEICKFVVALTRAKKQCHILHTRRFGKESRRPSVFVRWIRETHVDRIRVDRTYWQVPF